MCFSGAGISTQGLWRYPSIINNATIATEIAQFAPAGSFVRLAIPFMVRLLTMNRPQPPPPALLTTSVADSRWLSLWAGQRTGHPRVTSCSMLTFTG